VDSQGTRDLNPQPSVLETDALPVELVPYGGLPSPADPFSSALRDRSWLDVRA